MSAAASVIRGGQPSTTQPIAGPWLSPKVVTRNIWPKVLCDMRNSPWVLLPAQSGERQTRVARRGNPQSRHNSSTVQVRWGIVRGSPTQLWSRSSQLEPLDMMKKLAALGISAAIVFTPLAAIAQTPSPEATASPAATSEPMKPMKMKKHHEADGAPQGASQGEEAHEHGEPRAEPHPVAVGHLRFFDTLGLCAPASVDGPLPADAEAAHAICRLRAAKASRSCGLRSAADGVSLRLLIKASPRDLQPALSRRTAGETKKAHHYPPTGRFTGRNQKGKWRD